MARYRARTQAGRQLMMGMALARSAPSHYGKLAVGEQTISPSILAAACSSLPLLTPTLPAARATRRHRHAFAAAVVLLVHGLALLPLLRSAPEPALSTAQPVMVGVMVAPPTQQVAAKTEMPAAVPASVPDAPAPRPSPAPTQRLPTASVTPAPATERSVAAAAAQMPATREETATTHAASESTRTEVEPTTTTPPSYQAAYLANPQPPYPAMSRKLREEGTVRLHVMVSTDGHAETVKIKTGSGYERLDQAARTAVQEWRFVPARQRGQNVAGWIEVPIQFRLEK